jgi:hypothetical protein
MRFQATSNRKTGRLSIMVMSTGKLFQIWAGD